MDDIRGYADFLKDMNAYLADYRGKREMFSIDCGDIVGDSPHLFPAYIDTVSALDLPIYRAIGNHDMTYGGRTFEYSYSKFEELFGPIYYSFNKGKAHYIVIDNCFYVNRNYQYIGYVDERTSAGWNKTFPMYQTIIWSFLLHIFLLHCLRNYPTTRLRLMRLPI